MSTNELDMSSITNVPGEPGDTCATTSGNNEAQVPSFNSEPIWRIKENPARYYRLASQWTNPESSLISEQYELYVPEIQAATFKEKHTQFSSLNEDERKGLVCTRCQRFLGDLVIGLVSRIVDSSDLQNLYCERCLTKDESLRSESTFILFHWVNRLRVGEQDYIPSWKVLQPECDDCRKSIGDPKSMHCVGCRHAKSRDVLKLATDSEEDKKDGEPT
ncbi:hypothetical protein ONZ45_g7420 [Pleurotus djamor]|nr:hypothetical protein ONZ45_g7420 [Pleurotus djamor]